MALHHVNTSVTLSKLECDRHRVVVALLLLQFRSMYGLTTGTNLVRGSSASIHLKTLSDRPPASSQDIFSCYSFPESRVLEGLVTQQNFEDEKSRHSRRAYIIWDVYRAAFPPSPLFPLREMRLCINALVGLAVATWTEAIVIPSELPELTGLTHNHLERLLSSAPPVRRQTTNETCPASVGSFPSPTLPSAYDLEKRNAFVER